MSNCLKLSDGVSSIKGIGSKKKEILEGLGIVTVEDMLNHFPFRYRDRRRVLSADGVPEDTDVLVSGKLLKINSRTIGRGKTITECFLRDETCSFNVVYFNAPYIKQSLKLGMNYAVFGKMKLRKGHKVWTNPEMTVLGSENDKRGLIPVYKTRHGISSNELYKWIRTTLDQMDSIPDWIGDDIVKEYRLCDRKYSFENIHCPADRDGYRVARFRVIFEQLLKYQLTVRLNRKIIESDMSDASLPDESISPFIDSLPFSLTEGQASCIKELERDLINTRPMNRLVQGDVGCGKTVIAEAVMYKCAMGGFQAAMMAPTEILATQHFGRIKQDLERLGIRVGYLISGMRAAERREVIQGLADGSIQVVVGTHALIQNDVCFANLGLVITDEQHRFGVNQRKSLVNKGRGVNVCVMSATPIPRTLAATVFGDMDFSVIRSMPANRKPIITRTVTPDARDRAYIAVRDELAKGNRAYVIAPSIESEDDELSSVEKLYAELKSKFKGYKTGLIHGKLDKDSKDRIMADFADGKIDLLVATVVIEVGIDVPDATIIVIENSDRFGLAQMHQLRGRVGRSDKQSYCYLVNYSKSETAIARARAMTEMSDGFAISEEDYRLRGPGDISGTMQSGNQQAYIMELCGYSEILEQAIAAADKIMENPAGTDIDYVKRYMDKVGAEDNSSIL